MTRLYTTEQAQGAVTDFIATHGIKTAAAKCGVGVQFLRDVQTGKRPPSPKVLAALGLEWRIAEAVAAPRSATPTRTGAR